MPDKTVSQLDPYVGTPPLSTVVYIITENIVDPGLDPQEWRGTLQQLKDAIAGGSVDLLNVEKITFDTTAVPLLTPEGTIFWNGAVHTLNLVTGLGATIQIGQETLLLYHNDTGATIPNFTVLHPKSAATVGGISVPTPDLADASMWELCEGTLSVATHDILDGELGFATVFGRASGGNTSVFSSQQLWLSTVGDGSLTDVKPEFPDYAISMGGALNSSATEGEIFVSITQSINDTFNDAWNGAIRESFDFRTSESGGVVTGTLLNTDPLRNLTLLFSDGFYTFETAVSPKTIALIVGTDEVTATNYVFIPQSTKVLTVNTTGWPSGQYCKVAQLEVQSAASVQLDGGTRRNQNINNHIKTEGNNGHMVHLGDWVRAQNATWREGVEVTIDINDLPSAYISMTAGKVMQAHEQNVISLAMPTNKILVANDPDTPYREISNLNEITKFSDGSIWDGDFGKIVVWLIANKSGEPSFLCLNLPRDGEGDPVKALNDEKNRANYIIPTKYKGTGVLLGAFAIEIDNGNVDYLGVIDGYQDLRGLIPSNTAGGGSGGVTTFLGLDDTPSTYAGQAGNIPQVNDTEDGMDYVSNTQKYPSTTTPTTLAFLEDNDNYSPSFDEVVTTIPAGVIAEFLPGQKIKGTNYIYEAWNSKIFRTQLTQVINAPAMVSGTDISATETVIIPIADNVQQINVSIGLKGALAYDVQYMDIEVPSKAWTAYRGRITLLFGDNLSVGASTLVRLIDPQTSLEIVLPTPFVSGETVVLSSNGEKYFIL